MDVDKLSPVELDKMADVIADAVQAVDAEEEKKNAPGKGDGERTEKKGDASGKDYYELGFVDEGNRVQSTGFSMVDFLCLFF